MPATYIRCLIYRPSACVFLVDFTLYKINGTVAKLCLGHGTTIDACFVYYFTELFFTINK